MKVQFIHLPKRRERHPETQRWVNDGER